MSSPPPLPLGFKLRFDRRARFAEDDTIVYGGSPWRMLRLSPNGAAILRGMRDGTPVDDAASGALARRLVDAGLAEPIPPRWDGQTPLPKIEAVVPAFDRPERLARCLDGLAGLPVVVVDDGSTDEESVAAVVARHPTARLVRRASNGGPAAARNTGLSETHAELVAFVDSDASCSTATLRAIATHLADPALAAVAPRIGQRDLVNRRSTLAAFAVLRSPLGLGEYWAPVRPGSRVSYVPSTVLVARRSALSAVGGFDESLRYGEDVDLVWRLVGAGWSVRYAARFGAWHDEPATWLDWLMRRFRYGTSAGPLARRHPQAMTGPALAGLAAPIAVARRFRAHHASALPTGPAYRAGAVATISTVRGLREWGLPLWWPAILAFARRRRSRLALVAVAAVPPLLEWKRSRPNTGPLRWAAARLADDIAYGAGVWVGCVRARTLLPLLPALSVNRGARAHDDARVQ